MLSTVEDNASTGRKYLLMGRYELAINELEKLAKQDIASLELVSLLTQAYRGQGGIQGVIAGWKTLAEAHPDRTQFQDALVDAYEVLVNEKSTTTTTQEDGYSSLRLSVRHPYELDGESLFQLLYNSVDQFYNELDKLPNSGFALGFDILPDPCDFSWSDQDDISVFTGNTLFIYRI